jgi:type IV pilus assembly protein PilW
MKFRQKKQFIYGVSLVELMVSMAISLVLMLAIVNVYVGSKETYKVRGDFNILQELGRQILETVTTSVQMADHWGGITADSVTTPTISGLTGSGSCDSNWILDVSQPVFGEDGASAQSGISSIGGCFGANTYQPNTDVLILRFADGAAVSDSSVIATPNVYVRSEVETGAVLLKGGASNAITNTNISVSDAARNHLYNIEAYYVRNCSDSACTNDIPGLWRLTLNGGVLQSEVLADGVEQIQYTYGVDTDSDTVADQFLSASSVSDWSQIVSVTIDMVIRAPSQDQSVSDTKTYALAGGSTIPGGVDFTPSTAEQSYHRKQLRKLIQVRNRIRT